MALSTTNINTTAVKNELGESSNNIRVLATSDNINMFSKKKPLYSENTNSAEWYKGYYSDYGIEIPNYIQGGTSQNWTYKKPTGGSTSPYKLGHFRGYHHTATAPILQGIQSININRFFTSTSSFTLLTNLGSDYQIGVNDGLIIGPTALSNYYLGAEIMMSGKTTRVLTSVNPMDTLVIDWNHAYLYDWLGTATINFFLAGQSKTIGEAIPVGFWGDAYVLPNVSGSYNSINAELTYQMPWTVQMPKASASAIGPFVNSIDSAITPITTNGGVGFRIVLTNTTSSPITIYDEDLSITVDSTYYNYVYTYSAENRMVNDLGSTIYSVVTNPNTAATITVYYGNVMNQTSSGPQAPTTSYSKSAIFEIKYKGERLTSGNFDFETL